MHVYKQWPLYFIGRILPAAIAFFGIALYTRFLDPTTFGTYALLLSTSFLVGTTGFSWLRVATLRMMGTLPEADEPDYAATICVAFGAMALLVTIAITMLLPFYHMRITPFTMLLTAVCAVTSGWFELNVSIAQSRLQLARYGLLQSARAIGSLSVALFLIHAGLKVEALLGGFILGNCVSIAALGTWRPMFRGHFRRHIFARLFLFGWPSSAASLSSLSGTFQRFTLQFFGGTAVLGIFAAVGDFASQTIGLLIGTAALAGQPLAFRARDSGEPGQLDEQLRNNARLVFAVGAGASAGLIALAQPLANVYFGEKFRVDAGPLIVVFAVATLLGGLRASYFEQGFEIALKTRPIAILTALRVAIYIALSVVLIPRMGALGAAYASLVTEAVLLGVTIVWARSLVDMPIPAMSFLKMAVAALVMAGCIRLVPGREHLFGLVAASVVGIVVYAGCFVLLYFAKVRELWRSRAPRMMATEPTNA